MIIQNSVTLYIFNTFMAVMLFNYQKYKSCLALIRAEIMLILDNYSGSVNTLANYFIDTGVPVCGFNPSLEATTVDYVYVFCSY